MKHPLFESLGEKYPYHLEEKFDRILIKIEQLWDTPQIDDYFSDLIIDKRGGRQGFPKEVMEDIIRLSEFREAETMRAEQRKQAAITELKRRGIGQTETQFLQAVAKGDQALVDLFLRVGINIHAVDENDAPPVITALKKGYTVIARMLLKAGADVDTADKMGLTPLLLACGKNTQGFKGIAELLIQKGANVNVRDPLGSTPLLLALSGGTEDIAEMLIEHGANIAIRTRNGASALALAQKAGNDYIAQLLLDKGAKP